MQQQQQQQQQHHSDFRAREIRLQTVSDLDLEAVGPTWADSGETCSPSMLSMESLLTAISPVALLVTSAVRASLSGTGSYEQGILSVQEYLMNMG